MRDVVGPDFGISLDVGNCTGWAASCSSAGDRAVRPLLARGRGLRPDALLGEARADATRLCTGESLIRREAFLPFLQRHVTDVVMIETLNNGLSETRRIAELAACSTDDRPHNYLSPFGTLVNAHLCAAIPNARSSSTTPTTSPGRWT